MHKKYRQCRSGQRCNFSRDLERIYKREEHGWCRFGIFIYGHLSQNETGYNALYSSGILIPLRTIFVEITDPVLYFDQYLWRVGLKFFNIYVLW